jgi:hypothetical protein
MVSTSNYSNAIAFTTAKDGNGRITVISADGTILFSNQDSLGLKTLPGQDGGAGNGPIFWGKLLVHQKFEMGD